MLGFTVFFLRRGFVGHKQMMSGTIGMSATPNEGIDHAPVL